MSIGGNLIIWLLGKIFVVFNYTNWVICSQFAVDCFRQPMNIHGVLYSGCLAAGWCIWARFKIWSFRWGQTQYLFTGNDCKMFGDFSKCQSQTFCITITCISFILWWFRLVCMPPKRQVNHRQLEQLTESCCGNHISALFAQSVCSKVSYLPQCCSSKLWGRALFIC